MITNATILSVDQQADGRRYITEIQVDDQLGELRFVYLADRNVDIQAVKSARTAELNTQPQTTVQVTNDDGTTTTV